MSLGGPSSGAAGRLKAQGMEWCVWVIKHASQHQLKAMAPTMLARLLPEAGVEADAMVRCLASDDCLRVQINQSDHPLTTHPHQYPSWSPTTASRCTSPTSTGRQHRRLQCCVGHRQGWGSRGCDEGLGLSGDSCPGPAAA